MTGPGRPQLCPGTGDGGSRPQLPRSIRGSPAPRAKIPWDERRASAVAGALDGYAALLQPLRSPVQL